jgi:translation initiation factor 5
MNLNINNSDDIFYRYKMPAIQIKQSTNYTTLLNLSEICKSLDRSEKVILKYMSKKLGTASNIKTKQLNGTYSVSTIQQIIFDFINKYVLCYNCKNPETYFNGPQKNKMNCKACGHTNIVTGDLIKHM